jgi:wobble nucleotide-excising tRNase
VVIDDPFSSLDSHRLAATRECIERIEANCKQLIILTHSSLFLKEIYSIYTSNPKKFLIINITGEFQSTIQEHNIDDLLLDQYFDDI